MTYQIDDKKKQKNKIIIKIRWDTCHQRHKNGSGDFRSPKPLRSFLHIRIIPPAFGRRNWKARCWHNELRLIQCSALGLDKLFAPELRRAKLVDAIRIHLATRRTKLIWTSICQSRWFHFFATLWWWNLFPNNIKKSNNIWKRLPSQHCDWLGMLCPSREELCLPHTGRGWTRLACLGYGEQCSDPSAGKMIAIRSCAPPVCPRASFELWMQKKSKSKFGEKPSKDHQEKYA